MNKFNNKNISFCIGIFIISLYAGVSRIQLSQAEDMGLFLSVFGFVSKGYRLYSEIFEIKDPLFLWSGAVLLMGGGLKAPYFLDILLMNLIGIFSYKVARNYGFNEFISFIGSVVLIFCTSGIYYSTLRSTLFALSLIFIAIHCSQRKKYFISGLIIACVAGFKMPYLIFGTSILPLLLREGLIGLKNTISGFFTGIFLILIILILRQEWYGYIDMVRENFHYQAVYMDVVGRTSGVAGHLEVVREITGVSSIFILIIFALFTSLLAPTLKCCRGNYFSMISILSLPILTLIFLSLSAMWAHHFQVMIFFVWPITLITVNFIYDVFAHNFILSNGIYSCKNILLGILIFIAIYVFLLSAKYSGFMIESNSISSIHNAIQYKFYLAPEVKALDWAYKINGGEKTFFRIGANDDSGFGAQIDPSWKLICSRPYQYGQETKKTTELTLECLGKFPRYVVISPSFFTLERSAGEFSYFKAQAIKTLNEKFSCESIKDWPTAKICVKK